ncbi:MAG: transcriptional repressor [Oligoflexia bacterium]|nr:transcriptional repressor [Oligoflexia bacterium]
MSIMKEALKTFEEHLKLNKMRMTQERRQLFSLVMSLKTHFNSEEVLEKIKKKNLQVSRATVYRVLPVLVKANLIQQSLLQEGQAHFEVKWNKDHHDHLICSVCNKIIEFKDNTIEILQREIATKYGFYLEDHVMELVGKCKTCKKN